MVKGQAFLSDPIINTINAQITKIKETTIPERIVIRDGKAILIYGKDAWKLIEEFTEQRNKYIRETYNE